MCVIYIVFYIYIYIYIYIYPGVYIYIYIYIYILKPAYIYAHGRNYFIVIIYVYIYIYTCTHTYTSDLLTQAYLRKLIRMYLMEILWIAVRGVPKWSWLCLATSACIPTACILRGATMKRYVCMYVCMYTCKHAVPCWPAATVKLGSAELSAG